jgi:hypothetical protein
MEGQVPVIISPRNKVAQLYPQTLSSLESSDWLSLYSLCMDHIENISFNNSCKFVCGSVVAETSL